MTYLSTQPYATSSWEDICFPVHSVWLTDLLPGYEIVSTDRQQLVVGQMNGSQKTIFGIQSAEYTIIDNSWIREVVDEVFGQYILRIKYTATGEFTISIVLPEQLSVGAEQLNQNIIITNSYNGKTPFSFQGQSLTTMLDQGTLTTKSMYRSFCENGLMGWADLFDKSAYYQQWLSKKPDKRDGRSDKAVKKVHHSQITAELFKRLFRDTLLMQKSSTQGLTASIYEQMQSKILDRSDVDVFKKLPIPVQLAKQAYERLRLEERVLGAPMSYWLVYNAVNHVLFTTRSSLTLNDRYKLDERVFHQLAAQIFS